MPEADSSKVDPRLYPPALSRAAPVVWGGSDVAYGGNPQSRPRERPYRGLSARAGPPYEHLDLPKAVLHALSSGVLGGPLSGERGRLAGPCESDGPCAAPGDGVSLGIGQRYQGIVEGRLNVCTSDGHGLASPSSGARRSWHVSPCFSSPPGLESPGRGFRHAARRYFLVTVWRRPATGTLRPRFARALVRVRWPLTGKPRRCRAPR